MPRAALIPSREVARITSGLRTTEDAKALDDLVAIAGKGQAPCLVVGDRPMHEADEIVTCLASRVSEL